MKPGDKIWYAGVKGVVIKIGGGRAFIRLYDSVYQWVKASDITIRLEK